MALNSEARVGLSLVAEGSVAAGPAEDGDIGGIAR